MYELPPIKKVNIPPHPFATDWQAVIFRNFGTVPTEALARLLKTDVQTIEQEACRLGLGGMQYDIAWHDKGYTLG